SSGIGEHLCTHRPICGGFRITTYGTSGDTGIRTELGFPLHECASTRFVHHQNDEVSRLATSLKAETAAARLHHARCAPRSIEICPAATRHHPTPIRGADNESSFLHRR